MADPNALGEAEFRAMAEYDHPGGGAGFDRWLAKRDRDATVAAFEAAAVDAMSDHPSWNGANEAVRNRMKVLAEEARWWNY